MRSVILVLSLLLLTFGCDGNARVEMPDSGMDGMVVEMDGSMDDGMVVDNDASTEDSGMDAEVDASVDDAGTDAGDIDASVVDAGTDSGAADAGMDSSTPMDAGMDSGPTMVCGNGILEGTEICDEGLTPPTNGYCRTDCTRRRWYVLISANTSCPSGSQLYDGISPPLTTIYANESCTFPYTGTLAYAGNGVFTCNGSNALKVCTDDGNRPSSPLNWKEY